MSLHSLAAGNKTYDRILLALEHTGKRRLTTYKSITNFHAALVRLRCEGRDVEVPHNGSDDKLEHHICEVLPAAHPRPDTKGHHMLGHSVDTTHVNLYYEGEYDMDLPREALVLRIRSINGQPALWKECFRT